MKIGEQSVGDRQCARTMYDDGEWSNQSQLVTLDWSFSFGVDGVIANEIITLI